MPRLKQQPAAYKKRESKAKLLVSHGIPTPRWKVWLAVGLLFTLLLFGILWTSGVFKDLFAGPKIPLPRQVLNISMGMTWDQLLQKYPELKKKIRSFNDDPLFKIATLDAACGLTGASSLDLLFFKKQLYFLSASWEGEGAKPIPLEVWQHQYRRWDKTPSQDKQPLGPQVHYKEWQFNDGLTEMTLRDLDYPDHLQRWQDLRDASNLEAQAAFAKYRLEAGG